MAIPFRFFYSDYVPTWKRKAPKPSISFIIIVKWFAIPTSCICEFSISCSSSDSCDCGSTVRSHSFHFQIGEMRLTSSPFSGLIHSLDSSSFFSESAPNHQWLILEFIFSATMCLHHSNVSISRKIRDSNGNRTQFENVVRVFSFHRISWLVVAYGNAHLARE